MAQVLVDLQNVVQVSPHEHADGSQWPTEEAYKECVDSFHATEEEAEPDPSTCDSNIVPPSQEARPKFKCMPRLPGRFIVESDMEDDDTEPDHTQHVYCEMQDAQEIVYTEVEVPMDTLNEESENINEGNEPSESLLADKETPDPNAEAGAQMGAHASVIPVEEKDNVPIEKHGGKHAFKFAKCLLGTLSKDLEMRKPVRGDLPLYERKHKSHN